MENEQLLAEIKRRLVETLHPQRLIVFGSRARGDHHPESDLDLMVVMNGVGSHAERAWLIRKQLLDLPIGIDIVVYDPEEYERLRGWRSSIAAIAEREGRTLV